jgi:hypothetical protein
LVEGYYPASGTQHNLCWGWDCPVHMGMQWGPWLPNLGSGHCTYCVNTVQWQWSLRNGVIGWPLVPRAAHCLVVMDLALRWYYTAAALVQWKGDNMCPFVRPMQPCMHQAAPYSGFMDCEDYKILQL